MRTPGLEAAELQLRHLWPGPCSERYQELALLPGQPTRGACDLSVGRPTSRATPKSLGTALHPQRYLVPGDPSPGGLRLCLCPRRWGWSSPPHCQASFPSVSSLLLFSFRLALEFFKVSLCINGFLLIHSVTVDHSCYSVSIVWLLASPQPRVPGGKCLLATLAPPHPLRGFPPTSFLVPF